MFEMIFKLLCGHAIADYALQNDYIAKNKNRHAIPMGYDPKLHGPMQTVWPYVLGSHGLIHGMFVFWATGQWMFGLLEAVSHFAIDFGKCEKWYGIHTDQFLHIVMKLFYVWVLYR
jgi:hypothetical protein